MGTDLNLGLQNANSLDVKTERTVGGIDISIPGGVQHNKQSKFAIEMRKFEMDSHEYGPPGRPRHQVGFQEFPVMLYKVQREATGGRIEVVERIEAADDTIARNLLSRGFDTLPNAVAALEKSEKDTAEIAAARNYEDRNMSERARAESNEAEQAAGARHLGEIPRTPVNKKRGKDKAKSKTEIVEQKH